HRDLRTFPTRPSSDLGHMCPILYAILADRGYFPKELLSTFRRLESPVQGHPSIRSGLPGVEYSGGSLGNGLSFALGSAMAARLRSEEHTSELQSREHL